MFENDFENGIDFQALLENPVFVENCSAANLKWYREGGCDENRMNDDLLSMSSEVLCVGWKGGDSPRGCGGGYARILEWNGLFFVDDSNLESDSSGPYMTIQEAGSLSHLDGEISGSICVSCGDLTDEELTAYGLSLVGDHGIVALNGVYFIRREDALITANREEIEAANLSFARDGNMEDSRKSRDIDYADCYIKCMQILYDLFEDRHTVREKERKFDRIGPWLTRESIMQLPDDQWDLLIEIARDLEHLNLCRAVTGVSAAA